MGNVSQRVETTHISEASGTATSSVQWQLENRNRPTDHPITHNSKLSLLVCGKEGFGNIAVEIEGARDSIDLCCWGFDPGMELIREEAGAWPRGATFGDMLIAAGNRGVRIRLLVWHDLAGASAARNMPGHSHGLLPWRFSGGSNDARRLSAANSVASLRLELRKPRMDREAILRRAVDPAEIPALAREEYCHSWYQAALNGLLTGISIRKRSGSGKDIRASLASEPNQPGKIGEAEVERLGMTHMGTHHQKSILIDYAYKEGQKAVGYVMGLNSVTDYWDTDAHELDDARREQGGKREAKESVQGKEGDAGFGVVKPYRDYACRIDGGRALIPVYANFVTAWDRAGAGNVHEATVACTSWERACLDPPSALLRKAEAGGCSVQIVRTQPEERDKTIKEAYFHATRKAAVAAGYLYVENQYFQYEEWARHLLDQRRRTIACWKAGSVKARKTLRDMPIMHVFIVIPVPERAGMIPRTYDILATLGQQEAMTGQSELIKVVNKQPASKTTIDDAGVRGQVGSEVPVVVQHANGIDKPDAVRLESEFGLKICTAMLNVSGLSKGRWRYREIYIHSKLMLVDDTFFTLGSANLNQRSMAVDSELNLTAVAPSLATDLRKRIWSQLTGNELDGKNCKPNELNETFNLWSRIMSDNRVKKYAYGTAAADKKMTGFLLPLEDNRSSTMRLG